MVRLGLDWYLARAEQIGDYGFIRKVTELRWALYQAQLVQDWAAYNSIAHQLNEHGAEIPDHPVPTPFPEEQTQMGMFDSPVYLTGTDGYAQTGDIIWLHNAKMNGTVKIAGADKDQAKLLVSRERDGEQTVVYSAGAAIVNQIKRMDASDRARLPMEVRLDQLPSKQGSPTNVLTPADQQPPTVGGNDFNNNGANDF